MSWVQELMRPGEGGGRGTLGGADQRGKMMSSGEVLGGPWRGGCPWGAGLCVDSLAGAWLSVVSGHALCVCHPEGMAHRLASLGDPP